MYGDREEGKHCFHARDWSFVSFPACDWLKLSPWTSIVMGHCVDTFSMILYITDCFDWAAYFIKHDISHYSQANWRIKSSNHLFRALKNKHEVQIPDILILVNI